MLTVAVTRSSSDDHAIRYVLPVLWMTSHFQIMEPTRQNQRERYVLSSSPAGGIGGEVGVYDCNKTVCLCMLCKQTTLLLLLLLPLLLSTAQ